VNIEAPAYIAKQTEREFQRTVVDAARTFGWFVVAFPQMVGNPPGWPDLTMFRNGNTVLVELKTERGKLSPRQLAMREDLKAHGMTVYVWRPSMWDDIVALLEHEHVPWADSE
jgi:hypothetical protein